MSQFKDCLGREWQIDLTVASLRDVRKHAQIDLGKLLKDNNAFAEFLFSEPEALVEVLWVLCREQAEAQGVDAEHFARGFDGPTGDKAAEAVLAAVADFFPRRGLGRTLKERMPSLLAKMDELANQVVTEALDRAAASNNSAGNSPASAGSNPGA